MIIKLLKKKSDPINRSYGNKQTYIVCMGAKVDWDFRISDLAKNPDGTDV